MKTLVNSIYLYNKQLGISIFVIDFLMPMLLRRFYLFMFSKLIPIGQGCVTVIHFIEIWNCLIFIRALLNILKTEPVYNIYFLMAGQFIENFKLTIIKILLVLTFSHNDLIHHNPKNGIIDSNVKHVNFN